MEIYEVTRVLGVALFLLLVTYYMDMRCPEESLYMDEVLGGKDEND